MSSGSGHVTPSCSPFIVRNSKGDMAHNKATKTDELP